MRLSGLQGRCRPDKAFVPPSGAFTHQDQTMTTIALIDDHLIVRSGLPSFKTPSRIFRSWPSLAQDARRWRPAGTRGAGLYLRYLNAGPLRAEPLSQLPKGMATIMPGPRQPGAGRAGAQRGGARFPSKRCSLDELIAAVRTVSTGGCYLTPDIAIKLAAGR